jgi:RNA polymerase sigma-70 factor (family 1)
MKNVDEFDMVRKFQMGKEKGFTYFYNELWPALMYYTFRILNDYAAAEDIVEESFIKIWERHSTFTHPQVIKSWMYTTCRNAAFNQLKQEQSQSTHKERILKESPDTEESHIERLVRAEIITEVQRIISILPPECEKVFQRMFITGQTVREIAEALGLSISTIKNQKARGLEILRRKFPELSY